MAERWKGQEHYKPEYVVFRNVLLRWSHWREAMVPDNIGNDNPDKYSRRWGDGTHYYNKKTRRKLVEACSRKCCGIYEFEIRRGNERAVVYVGSTCRAAGKSLKGRISEYLFHGSHIAEIIQRALDDGFKIRVQWLKVSTRLFNTTQEGRKLAQSWRTGTCRTMITLGMIAEMVGEGKFWALTSNFQRTHEGNVMFWYRNCAA